MTPSSICGPAPLWRRSVALAAAVCLVLPLVALPAQAQLFGGQRQPGQTRQGMGTGKKVALVAGAALLYYLYKRHQAGQERQALSGSGNSQMGGGRTASAGRQQLYRSKNGGVYYRDAQNRPVWLTVPNRPVQVSTADLQRYAPDYQRYANQSVPAAPRGYRTQSFGDFNPDLYGSGTMSGAGGNMGGGMMNGGGAPPGPRGGLR